MKPKKLKSLKTIFSIGHAPWNHYIHSRPKKVKQKDSTNNA